MQSETTGTARSDQPGGRRLVAATLVAIFCATLIMHPAGAASFDCSRPTGPADKIVCADAQLSRLDDTLAQSYRLALQAEPGRGEIRNAQRAWLHDVRDQCANRVCLAAAYQTRIATLQGSAAGAWRSFRDPALQLQFSLPAGWSVTPGCHASRTCLALAHGPADRDNYLIALEGFSGDLAQVAAEHAIFRRTEAGWETTGRSDSQPVQTIDGPGWRGIRAVVPSGVADQLGNHSAGGQCLWAVLSDGRRAVVADTLGSVPIDADVNRVLESLRFLVQ